VQFPRATRPGLTEVRAAPDSPGHPTGEHSVLQCLHVLLNEEWEHHRYTVRDLDVLDPAEAQRVGSANLRATADRLPAALLAVSNAVSPTFRAIMSNRA
jgi:hypothetical protein